MKRGLILILITLLAVPFVFASPNGCSPVTGDLNDDFFRKKNTTRNEKKEF